MNIVVLDDIVLNQEQIDRLKKLGNLKIYFGTPKNNQEIIKRADEADILISGWTYYKNGVFKDLKRIKLISLWSTGYDYVDLCEAKEKSITITNVPGYAKNAVAELAISLMLAVMREIPKADYDVKATNKYNWQKFKGMELSNKTLGIIGIGSIGCRVAEIAKGFDMKVIAYDPYPKKGTEEKYNLKIVSYKTIFKESNIVTLHMPLLPSTKNIITSDELDLMSKDSIFINTARAGIVNQEDLYNTLYNGNILGAGLDDIDFSILSGNNLLKLNNIVVTPHIGFYTKEATIIKTNICISNVENFIKGTPINIVL